MRRFSWPTLVAWSLAALTASGCKSSSPTESSQPVALAVSGTGSGAVSSSPSGISCSVTNGQQGGTCGGTFGAGSALTLTATASSGSIFQGWGGNCSGSGTCSLTMSGPKSVTAQFMAASFPLTVTGAGNGSGLVTSNPAGIVCDIAAGQASGQCSAQFPAGTAVTLRTTAGANSTLAGWTGACTGTGTCTVTLDAAKSAGATLALLSYPVTVSGLGVGNGTVTSTPAGITCAIANGTATGTCSTNFSSGTNVTLTAAAASTSDFTGWSGFCAGTGTCALEVTGSRNVTASFGLKTFALTVAGTGAGTGTLTSTPAGINCTIASGSATGTCTASFAAGTQVTLNRSPASGSTFSGWSGDCTGSGTCVVTMDAARSVSAAFSIVLVTYTFTVTPAGNGSGTVTSSPAGIACTVTNGTGSGNCSATFPAGTSLQLTASATAPNSFGGWGAPCSGTGACNLTLNANTTLSATFNYVAPTQPLTVSGTGTGSGTVTSSPAGISCTISGGVANGACSFSFPENGSVTLTASPTGGGTFAGWSGACSGTGTCQVTMSAPRAVTAGFTAPPPAFAIQPDFAVLATGGNQTLSATLSGTTLASRNTSVATVSGLTVTGVATGATDVIGTNGANTDSSRIAVTPLDGFAVIATAAQNVAFNTVSLGGTIGLDLWLIKPAGGTVTFGSIQGTLSWDPTKLQFVSFSISSGAIADGWSVTPNTSSTASGTLQYAGFSASGTTGTFVLARLTLRALTSGTGTVTPAVSAASTASTSTIPTSKIVPVASAVAVP